MDHGLAQTGWAEESFAEVHRLPGALLRRVVEHDRRIVDQAGRRVSIVYGRGVDEGLERRAGLTPALRGAVELAGAEVQTPDQGDHRACIRSQRELRSLRIQNLGQ